MSMSQLDFPQVLRTAFNDATGALQIQQISGSLVTAPFDEIDLTYVAAGNGVGEIETAVYKKAGVIVSTLTLTYDSSNRISTVVKS